MVLHLGGGPHDTLKCYYTSSHELLEFLYEGRRCKNHYVTEFERTSKGENAVRMSHTNSGLMHPPAMSTNNDERDGGDLDLTATRLANVTIRDRAKDDVRARPGPAGPPITWPCRARVRRAG